MIAVTGHVSILTMGESMNFREFLNVNLNESNTADGFEIYAGIVKSDYAFAVVEYSDGKIVNVYDLISTNMTMPHFTEQTTVLSKIKELYKSDTIEAVKRWLTGMIKFKNLKSIDTLETAKSVRKFFDEFYTKVYAKASLNLQKLKNGLRENRENRENRRNCYERHCYLTERKTNHKINKTRAKACDVFADFDDFIETAKETLSDIA